MRTKLILAVFIWIYATTNAQVSDSSFRSSKVEQELTSADSLHIFLLLDSLIQAADFTQSESATQLGIRTGYNSNITATGRPFAFGNYGLSGGLTYLHKSGFFGDVSTYYSAQYKPSVFLTTATAGYLFSAGKHLSFAGEYSHYFYNLADTAYVAYTNSTGLTGFYSRKLINLRLDYSIYFGSKTGHRLNPAIGLNFRKDNFLGKGRLLFYPMVSVLFGVETLSSYKAYTTNRLEIIYRIRHGLPLFYEQKKNVSGVMNYSLTMPLSINLKSWTFILSYTYNIPKALAGESLSLTNGGYFSTSITKYLSFKGNKK
jgi:hypothetical protein